MSSHQNHVWKRESGCFFGVICNRRISILTKSTAKREKLNALNINNTHHTQWYGRKNTPSTVVIIMRLNAHRHRNQYGMVHTNAIYMIQCICAVCNFTLIVLRFGFLFSLVLLLFHLLYFVQSWRCCCFLLSFVMPAMLFRWMTMCPATPPSHWCCVACVADTADAYAGFGTGTASFRCISIHCILIRIYSISECTFCAAYGWLDGSLCMSASISSPWSIYLSLRRWLFCTTINPHIRHAHFECITVVYLDHCHSFSIEMFQSTSQLWNDASAHTQQALMLAFSSLLRSFALFQKREIAIFSHITPIGD